MEQIQLTIREMLVAGALVFSLIGNGAQLHRQRLHAKAAYNGLVGAFNSIAWLLARCLRKTQELEGRAGSGKEMAEALLKEFREFSLDTEFGLRGLQEQLISVAMTFRPKDKRWREGQFGHTPQEIEKIRKALSKDREAQF